MATDKVPDSGSGPPQSDEAARQHGRMGLVPSWQRIPWWGVIVMIFGTIVGYSMLTNARYLDAIYFIFDLPWDRRAVATGSVLDGRWTVRVSTPMQPGQYSMYVRFRDEADVQIGRSEPFTVRIPRGAEEQDVDPIPVSPGESVIVESTTPTFIGSAPRGESVVLVDDFSRKPLRILQRIVLANGVILTLRVTLISFVGALVLGLIFGLMRLAPSSPELTKGAPLRLGIGLAAVVILATLNPSWRQFPSVLLLFLGVEVFAFLLPAMPYTISTLYVEVIRGIPMLVIVLYMGFAVTPAFRNASRAWGLGEIDLRGIPAATIALAFGYGAYLAEVYRAGIQSIPRGQMEAARSVGMNYYQAMRLVILPQAIRVVLPPLGNDFIALLKDTSLISVIALPEILQQGRLWISRNFRAFEGYNTVAMLYLIMTLLLSLVVRYIERKAAIDT